MECTKVEQLDLVTIEKAILEGKNVYIGDCEGITITEPTELDIDVVFGMYIPPINEQQQQDNVNKLTIPRGVKATVNLVNVEYSKNTIYINVDGTEYTLNPIEDSVLYVGRGTEYEGDIVTVTMDISAGFRY